MVNTALWWSVKNGQRARRGALNPRRKSTVA